MYVHNWTLACNSREGKENKRGWIKEARQGRYNYHYNQKHISIYDFCIFFPSEEPKWLFYSKTPDRHRKPDRFSTDKQKHACLLLELLSTFSGMRKKGKHSRNIKGKKVFGWVPLNAQGLCKFRGYQRHGEWGNKQIVWEIRVGSEDRVN